MYPPTDPELTEKSILHFMDRSIQKHNFVTADYATLTRAKAIKDLTPVAFEIIDRLGGPFAIGIGPMRTGSTGRSFDQNLRMFDRSYEWVIDEAPDRLRLPVFYQIAFEIDIHRIRDERYAGKDEDFIKDLFGEFYRPILTDSRLRRVIRMPEWEKSTGASIEYKILLERVEQIEFIDIVNHIPNIRDVAA